MRLCHVPLVDLIEVECVLDRMMDLVNALYTAGFTPTGGENDPYALAKAIRDAKQRLRNARDV